MLTIYIDNRRRADFDKIVTELKTLKVELEAIQEEYSSKFPEEIDDIRREEMASGRPQNDTVSCAPKSEDVNISQLIKKIAQVCHPDKTSDATLNAMLVDALEARDRNPEVVIAIYERLFNTTLNIDDDIYNRTVAELHRLKASNMYRVLQFHKQQDKIRAKMTFLEILHNKLTNLRNLKKRV